MYELTKEEDNPHDLSKRGLVSRNTEPMGIQVIPERPRLRLFVLHIIDVLVLVIPLDPIASPEGVDDMLSFTGREEDLNEACQSVFRVSSEDRAITRATVRYVAHRTMVINGGLETAGRCRDIPIAFPISEPGAHDALKSVHREVVHDPPSQDLASGGPAQALVPIRRVVVPIAYEGRLGA